MMTPLLLRERCVSKHLLEGSRRAAREPFDVAGRHIETAYRPHVLDAEDCLHDEWWQARSHEPLAVLRGIHDGEREVLARDGGDQRSARLTIKRRGASRLVDSPV